MYLHPLLRSGWRVLRAGCGRPSAKTDATARKQFNRQSMYGIKWIRTSRGTFNYLTAPGTGGEEMGHWRVHRTRGPANVFHMQRSGWGGPKNLYTV